MFKKIDPKMKFPEMEKEILKFWEENKIFEKSVERNPEDKSFIFYEGPPTANGIPGLHHVLARAFKDVIPRYKTMKGFRVERKAGWDTHGLPVELQVEKELGIHNKTEIENIVPGNVRESIIEFNKKCKESVWKYKDLWEKLTGRMGYWVDMEHPYITYENKYMESVWWVIAQIFKTKNKNGESMIYKGHKVVPYCYRCGTALSSHEVAQGYQKVKDNSVFVKFKLQEGQKIGDFIVDDKTYVLSWTTTPWTLPGNIALAISEHERYIVAERSNDLGGEKYIYAIERAKDIFESFDWVPSSIEHLTGQRLIGLKYEPLYKISEDNNAYKIISGGFVTINDGTGIVHIAPAFGEDDARVGKENNLPTLLTVDVEGKIIKGMNIPGEGIAVKKKNDKNKYEVDELVIADLKSRGLLFKEESYEHDYPFCWRCDTPLIYYAKPSWFIRMSELREELVKNNEGINWTPDNIKEGRFGDWLRDAKDWAISRERYWGTPLPIWICKECGEIKVIESQKELEELSEKKLDDLHKPYIDEVTFKCSCGGEMVREQEVLDVWFDSGSMPLAQFFYPNGATEENKEKIENGKYFPADFISEAIDQTRGWFYTLHAISTLLNKTGKVPTGNAFKNVICLGHILDKNGKKMSKSKGNIVDSMEIMDEYGADMLRWMLYTINQPGLPKKFDPKMMKDIMNRVFRMLWNSYSFFVMYASIDKFKPSLNYKLKAGNLLDKWILFEVDSLMVKVDTKLNSYDIYVAAKFIEDFIDNLSNWYIRRSRKRFWKSENDEDKEDAYQTLHKVLVTLSKVMAPFTPFISEEIYRNLTGEKSVHLEDFPKSEFFPDGHYPEDKNSETLGNEWDISLNMIQARKIVNLGLKKRAEAKIKVRQPLAKIIVDKKLLPEIVDIIKEELNVKDVVFDEDISDEIVLDIEISEDLKLEGQAREIIRHIQEMRKEAGYEVDNRIKVCYSGMLPVFEKFGKMIEKEVLSEGLNEGKMEGCDLSKDFEVDGEKLTIQIKKI